MSFINTDSGVKNNDSAIQNNRNLQSKSIDGVMIKKLANINNSKNSIIDGFKKNEVDKSNRKTLKEEQNINKIKPKKLVSDFNIIPD